MARVRHACAHGKMGSGQQRPTFSLIGSRESDNNRNVGLYRLERLDKSLGHVVATRDTTKDIDKNGIDMLIAQQQLHGFHDFLRVDRKSTRLNSSHANISYAVF